MTVTDTARADLGGNLRHGDASTFCPSLWRHLIDRFAIASMLDVGCGEGHTVHFFRKHGVLAHGIDGLLANINRAVSPIALHDLLAGPYTMPVDFVWSSEVAEHIAPDKVDHYVDTLANGKIVAMTHAVPGQAGYHHVNCQPSEYWIEKMALRGFSFDASPDYRRLASQEISPNFFTSTGLMFTRN